jgi:hypothetical protein
MPACVCVSYRARAAARRPATTRATGQGAARGGSLEGVEVVPHSRRQHQSPRTRSDAASDVFMCLSRLVWGSLTALAVVKCASGASLQLPDALVPASCTYVVDAQAPGPRFDGIGAISGGGGETVLLPSYPAQQRDEILDYLFKPSFGAALHILKLEIGEPPPLPAGAGAGAAGAGAAGAGAAAGAAAAAAAAAAQEKCCSTL